MLQLKGRGLVKTVKFSRPRYVGDPINAVRIFNDLEADELVFVDISATSEGRTIDVDLVSSIGDEAFMPFSVGGGIKSVRDAAKLVAAGAEKIIVSSAALENIDLVSDLSSEIGSQSVVVSVDITRSFFGRDRLVYNNGKKSTSIQIADYVRRIEDHGAGEIIVTAVDRDGTMSGYDTALITRVVEAVNVPVVALGGAGRPSDLADAFQRGGAHAVAAGSLFVFHGPRKAVLINYPDPTERTRIFNLQ